LDVLLVTFATAFVLEQRLHCLPDDAGGLWLMQMFFEIVPANPGVDVEINR
jgi:hypothetical protein